MFFTFVRYVLTARGREGVTVMSTNPLNGDTALHQACRHARWPVVSWLVAAGADPEVRGGWGVGRESFAFFYDVFTRCFLALPHPNKPSEGTAVSLQDFATNVDDAPHHTTRVVT
jgi:hypothetical protein